MKKTLSLLSLILCISLSAQDDVAIKSQVAHAINEIREFIAIPNDALDAADIDRNIMWLKRKFGERGFNTAVLDTEGLPLFFAATPVSGEKPTVLIYMHFDGQSVDPTQWNQPNPYQVVLKSPMKMVLKPFPLMHWGMTSTMIGVCSEGPLLMINHLL